MIYRCCNHLIAQFIQCFFFFLIILCLSLISVLDNPLFISSLNGVLLNRDGVPCLLDLGKIVIRSVNFLMVIFTRSIYSGLYSWTAKLMASGHAFFPAAVLPLKCWWATDAGEAVYYWLSVFIAVGRNCISGRNVSDNLECSGRNCIRLVKVYRLVPHSTSTFMSEW